jgi:O-methyltransferase involved in polyketide biosynthesis
VTEPPAPHPVAGLDETTAQTARVWNFLLGGKDNFEADRVAGQAVIEANPAIRENAVAGRKLLQRAVTFLAGEAGIRQFLDVGTGLPTANNTHEVAQRIAPTAKIVYVDNDPLVLVHARALLTSTPEGVTAYVDADARDTAKVLAGAREALDFDQPIALIMCGILGHFDYELGQSIVRELTEPLAPGSYFLELDGTASPENVDAQNAWNANANPPYWVRTIDDIAGFFPSGFELVEPGVVSAPLWRPEPGEAATELDLAAGLGVKR